MRKIGIWTIIDYKNYGNRLQNYATQEILKSMDYKAETIINIQNYRKFWNKIVSKQKNILQIIKEKINKLKQKSIFQIINKRIKINKLKQKNKNDLNDLNNRRLKVFKDYSKKYISETDFEIYIDEVKNIKYLSEYYKIVVGSDQIWNPNFRNIENKNDFLQFVVRNKRIAFSVSFGISKLKYEQSIKYKKWIKEIPFISCRETEGAKLIDNLTEIKVPVLLDPTMTLEKKNWLEFKEVCDIKPENKYILTYFLGEISEKANNILKKYKEEGYKIVKLNSLDMPEYYAINPSEWVDFVNDASLFLTDSFHGVAFAHILKTPFVVYNRIGGEGMSSRITTILEKFNTEDRFELDINSKKLLEMNFSGVDEILEMERKRTYDFLKNALGDN